MVNSLFDFFSSPFFQLTLFTLFSIVCILTLVVLGWLVLWVTLLHRLPIVRELLGLPPLVSTSPLLPKSSHKNKSDIPKPTSTSSSLQGQSRLSFKKNQKSFRRSKIPSSPSTTLLTNRKLILDEFHFAE
ncbi:hypothetical protein HMI54_015098 [Coelomomyces lativittatus]|nr:hypothetical protein HMI56_005400 [Coelomomyces lativittatus]KAJ1518555.1 hypothetical protein HMI54_015098 [Coelomomyces lativittatus]